MAEMYAASVRSKQGGPIFLHSFEAETVSALLHHIAEAVDLERADSTTIEIKPTLESATTAGQGQRSSRCQRPGRASGSGAV